MTTILPCPFCGHDDVNPDEVELRVFAIMCPECECIGPISRESIEAAIELWNCRARATQAERFAANLLDPDIYGHAITAEVRDAARRVLGVPCCETVQPVESFNEGHVKRAAIGERMGSSGQHGSDCARPDHLPLRINR